jgi:group I intron endonuclease
MVIYLTKNLVNGRKYVGKDSHNNPNYLGSGTLFLEDVKKYGKENFKKEILEYCTRENLGEREEYWIKFLNAVESNDYYNIRNQTSGWNNKNLNKEKYNYVCGKISKSLLGISRPNLKNNQERKEKISKANKNKPKPEGFGEMISKIKLSQNIKMSDDTKNKISEAKTNHPCFQEQSFKEKHHKPIIQLNQNNEIVNEFKSIQEAEKSNPKFKRSNISCCLTGFSKTAYGYKWAYKII